MIDDETCDASYTEQMTVYLRYLDIDLSQIKEMFVGFIAATDEFTGGNMSARKTSKAGIRYFLFKKHKHGMLFSRSSSDK